MGESLRQLPEDALRLLSAEKDVPEVPAELRARLAERLLASTNKAAAIPAKTSAAAAAVVLAGTDVGKDTVLAAAVGQGAAASKGLGAWALSSKLLLAGVVTFGVGGGAGAALHSMAAGPPPAGATSVIVVEAPPRATSVVVLGQASATPLVSAVPTAEPVLEPTALASSKPSAAPRLAASASADPLRRERSLLDTARAAVLRGDKAAALESLAKHAREFPNGQHAADRLALEKRANALP